MSDARIDAVAAQLRKNLGWRDFNTLTDSARGAYREDAKRILAAADEAERGLADPLAAALEGLVVCLTEGGNGEGWTIAEFLEPAIEVLARFHETQGSAPFERELPPSQGGYDRP